MKKLLLFLLLVATPVFAQEDPRLCQMQLQSAEGDVANLLRSVHAIGAQRDIAIADGKKLQQQVDDLKKQLEEAKKAKPPK